MSFLSSIKKALGFSNELDEDEMLELTDDEVITAEGEKADVPRVEQSVEHSVPRSEQSVEHNVPRPIDDETLPGDIFDAVIKLFNDTQPEFVSSCLNTEQQREYIFNHIDEAVKQRLQKIMEQARVQAAKEMLQSQNKMTADIARLRELNASLEAKKDEFQSAQLSASRQKRALNERVHDLETQVSNLEAEKEQFQLENRSLINKLRVASVTSAGSDTEQLAQENIALKDQIENLENQIKTLQDEQQHNHSEADAELKEIMEKVEQFEAVKQRLDSRIADLKSQLADANDRVSIVTKELDESKSENESLRKTIETNLYAQAQSENDLNAKIAELTALIEKNDTPKPESQTKQPHTKRKSKKRPVISAIDDLMENTDWFVAQEPTPMKKSSDGEDDFGYKEPAKKPNSNKDDDKQLSLF